MRVIDRAKTEKSHAFAEKAAAHFQANAWAFTFADGDPVQGELFAIRWNPYTVLVVELSADFEPECHSIYQLGLHTDLPRLCPKD